MHELPMITAENAAELAAKSHIVRREKKLARIEKLVAPAMPANIGIIAGDDYAGKTLIRVRANLDDTLTMLENEDEPGNRQKLAMAIDKLAEIERRLSGRSLPPSQKPSAPKNPKRSPTSYPEPVPQFQVAPALEAPQADPEMPSI